MERSEESARFVRYLTPETKSRDGGDREYVDEEILPFVEELDALPGLCVFLAHAGGEKINVDFRELHIYPASVRLMLCPELSAAFDERVFVLLTALDALGGSGRTVSIRREYALPNYEFTWITFQGNDCGLLEESSEIILRFFRELITYAEVAWAFDRREWQNEREK